MHCYKQSITSAPSGSWFGQAAKLARGRSLVPLPAKTRWTRQRGVVGRATQALGLVALPCGSPEWIPLRIKQTKQKKYNIDELHIQIRLKPQI